MRRTSVLAESQNLGAGGIHFRRVCEVLTVSIKITTSKGVVIFMDHRNTIDAWECRNRQISLRIKRPPSQRISNEMAVNIFIMV